MMNPTSDKKREHRRLLAVYVALMVLLGATFGAAYLPLGSFGVPLALLIAGIKAALVGLIFMELRKVDGLHRVAAITGMFFLGILFTLALSDYLTRDWMEAPGKWPQKMTDTVPPPPGPGPSKSSP